MIIVPIGIDCAISDFLNRHKLRKFSLPFDWIVTYNSVHDIINNSFEDFIPDISGSGRIRNDNYNVLFMHDHFPEDSEKYKRRINRLYEILNNTNDEVVFVRRSHLTRHHGESKNITNDFDDSKKLCSLLQEKYPKLKFKIVLVLMCGNCFNHEKIYKHPNIEVHNICSQKADNSEFHNFMDTIVNLFK